MCRTARSAVHLSADGMHAFRAVTFSLSLLVVTSGDCKDVLYRLPKHVWPLNYNLRVHTSHDGYTFKGQVSIDVIAKSQTSNITVHRRDLQIDNTSIVLEKIDSGYAENDRQVVAESATLPPPTEVTEPSVPTIAEVVPFKDYIIVSLDRNITEGDKYRLNITFSGKTNVKRFKGYYRVQPGYAQDEWLTGTVFTKDLARRAFPCLDEPEFKSRFAISLAHHNSTTALSNMPLKYSEPMEGEEEGWIWDHFELTPLMSTYLIGYHIGKFKSREVMTYRGRPFRVWGPATQMKWANRTLDDGPKYVAFFENYTGLADPMPKQDLVAIPKFYDGLENWGLVSFLQSNLLYPLGGERLNGVLKKTVVAHEMAHTWFGNLVTHEWWDQLWLSEGFATYFAALAVHHTEPSWDQLTEQTRFHLAITFDLNTSPAAEALSAAVVYPEDMKFSIAPYSKGLSLIRMIHLAVGDKVFRNSVGEYLRTCSYGSANQKTLFDIITRNAHDDGALPQDADVNTMMQTWTYRAGLPVLRVNRTYTGEILLSQEKYVLNATVTNPSSDETGWWIPITYSHERELQFDNTTARFWLDPSNDVTTIDDPADQRPTNWIVFNNQLAGTYRVLYDEYNVRLLIGVLDSDDYEKIPPMNRFQLISDYGQFSLSGKVPVDLVMELVNYLHREKHSAPWSAFLRFAYRTDILLQNSTTGNLLQEYARNLVSPEFQRLGMKSRNSDTMNTIQQREQIILAASRFQHSDCVQRVSRLFRRWQSSPQPDKKNPISPDVRLAVYCSALRQGTEKEWKFLWERYLNTRNVDHRETIKTALSCTQAPEMIKRFFLLTIGSKSNLTGKEQIKILQEVSANENSVDVLLNIMERLSPYMRNANGQKFQWYSAVLPNLSQHVSDNGRLERLKGLLLRANMSGTAAGALETAIAVAERNIQWKLRNENFLRNYFLSRRDIQNENTLVPSLTVNR